MDTATWILAAVIVIVLTLWIVSTARGGRRRQHTAHPSDRPPEQAREDRRTFRRDELSSDGF